MAYFCSSKYNRWVAVSYESPLFSKSFKTSFTVSLVHVKLNCTEWIIGKRYVNITFKDQCAIRVVATPAMQTRRCQHLIFRRRCSHRLSFIPLQRKEKKEKKGQLILFNRLICFGRFGVVMAASTKVSIFWNAKPYYLVHGNQGIWGTCWH